MRRAVLLALTISMLLGGCASDSGWKRQLEEKRGELRDASALSFTADISADLGESVFECSVKCTRSGGETELTVLAPELAAGITARIKDGETRLSYDGIELSVGTLKNSALTPVGCVPALLDALLEGFITGVSAEQYDGGRLLTARIYVDESSYALVWFSPDDLTPLRAELICAERMAAGCTISDFSFE